jgi:hypothetical protein
MYMSENNDWTREIQVLADQLISYYIDSGVAADVAALLRRRLTAGDYAACVTGEQFAERVTADMQSVNGDPHLYLSYTSKFLPDLPDPVLRDDGRDPRLAEMAGHGFAKVERLPGNVGLLDIRRFYDPVLSGGAVISAMNLVASADALIIDLRLNTGGEPETVALVHSYLVDDRTKLNSVFFPAEDRTVQFWTHPYVPGNRFGGQKPVYVLISSATFSAGEGFSYDLQQYRRATLIGERTKGGANFHLPMRVSDHLFSAIPSGYPVQPVSGDNWEGVGVQPDIPVPAEHAFDEAYRNALADVLKLDREGVRRGVAEEASRALAALPVSGRGTVD